MRQLKIQKIALWSNQVIPIYVPDFSEILDISEMNGQLNILYQYDSMYNSNTKMFNLYIIENNNIYQPPSDYYKYFGKVEATHLEVNLSNANGGRIIVPENKMTYYIFIEEIKTIAENREEKLKDIL